MHMALIDSMLWVMISSVSQHVAHSSRPWRCFDVCFVWNAYTPLYIQCDIYSRMFCSIKYLHGERQIKFKGLDLIGVIEGQKYLNVYFINDLQFVLHEA